MKIVGVGVEVLGDEKIVIVKASLASNEELEDADVHRILGVASEAAGDSGGNTGGTRRARGADVGNDEGDGGTPRRGRRGGASADDVTEEEKPTRRGGRAEPEEDDDAGEPEEKPARRRKSQDEDSAASAGKRRRGSAAEETSEEDETTVAPVRRRGSDKSSISDTDLMKACSETSRATSAKMVKSIIEQFGVDRVEKIKQAERQEFLDLCKEARDA